MGRAPCCDKANVKKGPWSPEEDMTLKNYLEQHGTGGNWIALPHKAGLKRCGKSCRLRWLNYLRPDIKHGGFTEEEDNIICSLYNKIGSRWSVIASHLPGRTDNDIKNYWNTRLKKKLLTAEKVPKTDHSIISNHPNHLNSAQFPPSLVKTETDNYQMFSPFLNTNTTTFPYPIELTTYQQKQADDPIQFPLPELMDVLDFSTSNNNDIMSSSQEISSLSASSSSQAMNLCTAAVPWSDNNGGGMEDRFLMDFGFNGSSCDLVNGYVFQEYSEIDPNLSY